MHVLSWLTDLNFKSVQAEKLSQRVGNTGSWFLKSEQFQRWVEGSAASSCLWCPGNPGVGKTILAAIIIDYLQSLNHKKNTVVRAVLSIFCDYRSAAAQTVASLLYGLLKQLGQGHGFSSATLSFFHECLFDETRPSLDLLIEILSEELRLFHRVYIVLDALDEFSGDNREVLINTIKSLGAHVYLLVTSRDIVMIGSLFKKDARLHIRAVDDDINLYIESRLSCDRLSRHIKGRGDLREAILTGVAKKARGMFLLAGLHMDSLAQTTNRKMLRDAINKLPDNMADAYDQTLERVDSQGIHDKALAYRIFGWIAFAKRPLTVLEMRYALAVEKDTAALDPDNLHDDDLLGNVCAGLVTKIPDYTAQEYFVSRKDVLFPDNIHDTITRTCLTYMSFDNLVFSSGRSACPQQLAEMNPLLHYSSSCWAYHAKKVELLMKTEIIAFLCIKRNRVAADTFRATFCGTDSTTPLPLQFAAYHGLVHIVEALLIQGADPQKEPPLMAAVQGGHLEMVKLLLSQTDVDINRADSVTRRTPLMEAASHAHEEVVKVILESKHLNSLNAVDQFGDSALFWAISRSCPGVVRILLATPGINVTLHNNSGRSLLAHAASLGQNDIVEMLLDQEDIAWSPETQQVLEFYAEKLRLERYRITV
ncbi:uncharacterized protein EV420DRAFT_1279847 [Desarmillaria tabescens]|uniref:Nephrocystin 3-like N-terminal domain-containing protein n=1 Tax=Armillaria tabescens TaxID=1929756 RepID=A0AA39JBD5_ARMTA|nr:uncharacterized protein EV420DRAFT_1279847 [Desarmillaria tabescens]KAK0438882.1 hypothetical protein EV420DRAFT_1279847 [Desarmillaria tabescens]